MFPPQREQVERWTCERPDRWEGGERILSRALVASAQPPGRLPSAVRGGSRSTRLFLLHGSALDVGKTGALRVANVRLGFQLKLDSEEGMKQLLLCSVSFLILKKGLNEQVEMISPRIYEQASNPANCHGGGPVGSGGELIFPVLWATAAFSNCVTEQGRYLVVLHGEPPVREHLGLWWTDTS